MHRDDSRCSQQFPSVKRRQSLMQMPRSTSRLHPTDWLAAALVHRMLYSRVTPVIIVHFGRHASVDDDWPSLVQYDGHPSLLMNWSQRGRHASSTNVQVLATWAHCSAVVYAAQLVLHARDDELPITTHGGGTSVPLLEYCSLTGHVDRRNERQLTRHLLIKKLNAHCDEDCELQSCENVMLIHVGAAACAVAPWGSMTATATRTAKRVIAAVGFGTIFSLSLQ